MEFRIMIDDIRVISLDGRLMAVINTTPDEMETAVKDRPLLIDRCKRLAEMVRETQTPEVNPLNVSYEVPPLMTRVNMVVNSEPDTVAPRVLDLHDGTVWPCSETARKMFGGAK